MENRSIGADKQNKRFVWLLSAGIFLFYAFLMWCTPYSSDDLEFAHLGFSTVGEYIRFALSYGNGRFLGNLTAFLFCNSKLICVIGKAFILTSAVMLAPVVLGLKHESNYLMSFLLVTAMTPEVLGEAVIWTSGFGNYVPPIWLSLLIVLMIQRSTTAGTLPKILIWIAVPVMGVASQLFIEHSSGVNGLLAFCFLVHYLRKGEKSKAALCALWLVSVTIGLGLMFMIPKVFYRAGNRVENYQHTHIQSISTIIIACMKNGIHLLSYYFGACEIPLCFGAIVTVLKTRQKRSEAANRTLLTLVGLAAIYVILAILISVDVYRGKSAVAQHVLTGASVLVPLGVWIFAAFKLEAEQRKSQLFLLAFAVVSIAPLLVVSPTPPRTLLQSYVFIVLAALQCFDWSGIGQRKHAANILISACLALCLLLAPVFFSIRNMAAARSEHIGREIANGATKVEIFLIPYQYTTWDLLWSLGYPYENGGDVVFDDMDFYSWMNKYY